MSRPGIEQCEKSIWLINLSSFAITLGFTSAYFVFFADKQLLITGLDAVKSQALVSTLVFFPTIVRKLTRGDVSSRRRIHHEAALTLFILTLLCVLGVVWRYLDLGGGGWIAVIATGLLAVVLGMRSGFLRSWMNTPSLALITVFLIVTLAVWMSVSAWGKGYQSPDFYERILSGSAHIDTLFHAAIANSISVFGFPSTAVDGAPYQYYHWGSHWVFAYLAGLMDMRVLAFYNIAAQSLVLFLLVKGIGLLSLAIRVRRETSLSLGIEFPLVLLAAMVTFWPDQLSRAVAVWGHFLVSESYTFALAFSLLSATLVVTRWERFSSVLAERVFLWITIPLLIGVTGLLKISVMVLLAGSYLFWLLRSRSLFNPNGSMSAVVVMVVSLTVLFITRGETGSGTDVHWFYFLLEKVAPGLHYKILFFLLHYLWVWVFLAMMLMALKPRSMLDFRDHVRSRKLIELEILFAVAVAGFIPGEVLPHRGGSFVYFSDVQRWLAVTMIIAAFPGFWASLKSGSPASTGGALAVSNGPYRARGMIGIAVFTMAIGIFWNVSKVSYAFAMKQVSNTRPAPVDTAAQIGPREMLEGLVEISDISATERAAFCLHVPKTNRSFWDLMERPGAVSFAGVAVSGVMLIDGLPEESLHDRGFHRYVFPDDPAVSRHPTEIVKKATAHGCRQIFVLRDDVAPILTKVNLTIPDARLLSHWPLNDGTG